MAVTFADLTVDPQTLVDADPTSPVRIIVRTNTGGAIIDSAANKIFLGTYSVDTETTATISLPVTNGATNPTNFQYAVDLEYVDAATRTRKTWSSGWFSFTAAANLASIAAEQYVPPTWMTTAVTTLQGYVTTAEAARDATVTISGLTGEDAAVGALIEGTAGAGPITRAALSASFVGYWQPNRAYALGDIASTVDGQLIERTTAGTSAATYTADAANWSLATGLSDAIANHPEVTGKINKDDIFVNVKDHGAVGDGVTDDTAAIQAAIAALTWPANNATLIFPRGKYLVSANCTIDGGGATSTPNLTIIGDSAWLTTNTAGVTCLDITNSVISLTRAKVRGIFFRPNAAGAYGARWNNAELCSFTDCSFGSSFGVGLKITGTSTYGRVDGCEFVNLSRGIEITGDASYLTVAGNQFAEQLSGSPLNWINASTVQSVGVSIVDNTFYGTGATLPVIRIEQGIGWIVEGNKFSQCDHVAISASGGDGVSYGHSIIGNSFRAGINDDILINGGRKCTIMGNNFQNRRAGITASTYCNVRVLNAGGGAAGSDNTIIGNTSSDTGTALLNSFKVDSACANTMFLGNTYFIAASIPNTSTASFGRDGAQVPLGQHYHNGIASVVEPLARNNTIDGKVVGTTTLYTVPTGKTAIVTGAIVQSGAAVAITAGPTLGIGIAAGEDDIYPSTALTGLTSNVKTYVFPPQGLQASAPAGSVIKVGIDTASTGTSQGIVVTLLGYLI